jgi:hypothetical protein
MTGDLIDHIMTFHGTYWIFEQTEAFYRVEYVRTGDKKSCINALITKNEYEKLKSGLIREVMKFYGE